MSKLQDLSDILTRIYVSLGKEVRVTITGERNIMIANLSGEECITLNITGETIDGDYKLYVDIDMVRNCGVATGSDNINCIKRAAKEMNFYMVNLKDKSILPLNFEDGSIISISLKNLFILSTGRTWYNRLGFEQYTMNSQQEKINEFIHQKIKDIIKNPNVLRDKQFSQINSDIMAYISLFEINPEMTVSDIFSGIHQKLKHLPKISGTNILLNNNLNLVTKYDAFITFMYKIMLISLGLARKPDPFTHNFQYIIPYESVSMDEIDGGNKSKRNKSKRNKTKRNKSKRNKSKRNKSKRNKSKRNKSKFYF